MNEPVTEKMQASKERIRQEACGCPLQTMRRHVWRAFQNRSLALLLASVVAGALHLSEYALAATAVIKTPKHARLQGLESLRRAVRQDGGVPLPENLDDFITNRKAAVRLGKALFWDMQVGSDGVQACASCHFHAGTDDRSKNAVNPGLDAVVDNRDGDVIGYFTANPTAAVPQFETRQANETLSRDDFPFVKTIQDLIRASDGTIGPGVNNSNDIAGSMGILFTSFNGVRPGNPLDSGTPQPDSVFNVDGLVNVRQVESKNTPTVINAVFNFTNFWNGSANHRFNGKNVFGDQDRNAAIFVNRPGIGLVPEPISLDNASLASQAMNPPRSPEEMSFGDVVQGNTRQHREIGRKLLRRSPKTGVRLIPLGLQFVHPGDSVLGRLSKAPFRGLSTSYEAMIKQAFAAQYWNSSALTKLPGTPNEAEFTQMEANFGFFFGLAVALYEATLVSDQTPFDQWMETGRFNRGFTKTALVGLNVFVNEGQCVQCHAGPELTKASVRAAEGASRVIRAMQMGQGAALYDTGFYNTSVTPTTDDLGRGGADAFGQPLAFARLALFDRLSDRLGTPKSDIPIPGNDHIPARDEDAGSAVCEDTNANGLCEPTESLRPEFQRVAVDGAFKTPGLRNVELTGPYFHNGGMATLRQVVQFYNRGGNFCSFNLRDLDPSVVLRCSWNLNGDWHE
ncbi:MAG: cytochrome-c peroxidase [Gammaproteobacteria bacterium]